MRNVLERYSRKVIGKNIDMDGVYFAQCVDLVKHYTINVMNISLGTFGGSALTGWENESNTFPVEDWMKVYNDYTKPNQVPSKGDVIFFSGGEYGHVGIVLEAYKGENKIKILNQNTGNGDGQGKDDVTSIEYITYNDCLGWYVCKRFIIEYKGIPVFIRKQPKNKPRTNASYYRTLGVMVLYERFFSKDKAYRDAILEHEYAHHIYYKLPSKYTKLWKRISTFDKTLQTQLELMGYDYTVNAYVNNYAKKNIKEDFAECWEDFIRYGDKAYGDYRDFKIQVVKNIMKRYL